MKKEKEKFAPFSHENLELKNKLIDYARELRKKGEFENHLAASFIYVSFTEYMAEHLLDNLRYFCHICTYNQYAGILFIDEVGDKKTKTLGQIIGELGKFNFPDKQGIISLFSNICKLRNKIFHNFATADLAGFNNMGNDLTEIQEKTEELLIKINTVYVGLQKILIPSVGK